MVTSTYVLDGMSSVSYYSGTGTRTQDWDDGWIGYLSEWYDGGNLSSNVTLTGSDWTIAALRFNSSGSNTVNLTDTSSQNSNVRVKYLELGDNSTVTLTHARVNFIEGHSGVHTLTLGVENTRAITLYGTSHTITTGTGYVGSIDLNGNNSVIVKGNVGSIQTDRGNDDFTVMTGYVTALRSWDGADTLTVSDGGIDSAKFRTQDSVDVLVSGNGEIETLGIRGDGTIDVRDTGRISHMDLSTGTFDVSTGDRWTRIIEVWQGDSDITIGSGGIGTLRITGANSSATMRFDGYVESLFVYDGNAVTISVGDRGSGYLRTDDGNDVITLGNGSVDTVTTRGGRDKVTVNDGSLGVLRTGDGNDTVITNNGWVELIATGNGNDMVTIGPGSSSIVRLGAGNDRLKVKAFDGGYQVSGGDGIDTLDFSAINRGVTFSLNEKGAYQEIYAKVGTEIVTGYVSAIFIEELIGTKKADTFTGNDADNRFISGKGKDVLTGMGGDDVFVFAKRQGTNTIEDFTLGEDKIEIGAGASRFGQLNISQDGADAVIKFARTKIILTDVEATDLSNSDFIF